MTARDVQHLLASIQLSAKVQNECQLQMNCPFAEAPAHRLGYDKDQKFGIKVDGSKIVWSCFVCQKSGIGLERMLLELELEKGIPTVEARQRLRDYAITTAVAEIESLPTYEEVHRREAISYPVFPESHIEPFKGTVPRYLLDRGVLIDTCRTWELGYDEPARRAIFPVRDTEQNLVGAVGRTTKEAVPRYKNYWNFDRRFFLYGEHLFPPGATAVLVEGPIDVVKAYQALEGTDYFPLGSFGAKMTDEQIEKILRLTGDRVVSLLDPDQAGIDAFNKLKKRAGRRIRLYRSLYPDPSSDPGTLAPELIREAVFEAELTIL